MSNPRYNFCLDAWENSDVPSICRENPTGADPYILCQISRVYRPDDLYDLCRLANVCAAALEAARQVVEASKAAGGMAVDDPTLLEMAQDVIARATTPST